MHVVRIYVTKEDPNSPRATSHISGLGGLAKMPPLSWKLLFENQKASNCLEKHCWQSRLAAGLHWISR